MTIEIFSAAAQLSRKLHLKCLQYTCYISGGVGVRKVSNSKKWVTFNITQGHRCWWHSLGHIRFPVSSSWQRCRYLAPFLRYYHLFRMQEFLSGFVKAVWTLWVSSSFSFFMVHFSASSISRLMGTLQRDSMTHTGCQSRSCHFNCCTAVRKITFENACSSYITALHMTIFSSCLWKHVIVSNGLLV